MSLVRMAQKPILVLVGAVIAVLVGAAFPPIWYANWTAAVPGLLIALLVVALLWPSAGLHHYFAYRPPQLIFTLTMEVWILLGVWHCAPHRRYSLRTPGSRHSW